MEISPRFTLVGEDMEAAPTDLAEAGPGTVLPVDQDLYWEAGEPFSKGEHAGWLHGTLTLSRRDHLVCQYVFSLESDPEDAIIVAGLLPREGNDTGGGVLAVIGGTGRFAMAEGTVRVETRNPKRYSF